MSVICIDNSTLTPSAGDDGAPSRKLTGFALPGYASRAARKGHALGLCRRWTADEAREHASAAGRASVARRIEALGRARLLTKGEALP